MGAGDATVPVVCDYSLENETAHPPNVVAVPKLEVDHILEKVVRMDLEPSHS